MDCEGDEGEEVGKIREYLGCLEIYALSPTQFSLFSHNLFWSQATGCRDASETIVKVLAKLRTKHKGTTEDSKDFLKQTSESTLPGWSKADDRLRLHSTLNRLILGNQAQGGLAPTFCRSTVFMPRALHSHYCPSIMATMLRLKSASVLRPVLSSGSLPARSNTLNGIRAYSTGKTKVGSHRTLCGGW